MMTLSSVKSVERLDLLRGTAGIAMEFPQISRVLLEAEHIEAEAVDHLEAVEARTVRVIAKWLRSLKIQRRHCQLHRRMCKKIQMEDRRSSFLKA